jgi:predicted cobalt transporter CbtA
LLTFQICGVAWLLAGFVVVVAYPAAGPFLPQPAPSKTAATIVTTNA